MEKKRKRLISISIVLGILIGLLYLFYSYFMKTEVYVSFDETRSGSSFFIDGKKVLPFKKPIPPILKVYAFMWGKENTNSDFKKRE